MTPGGLSVTFLLGGGCYLITWRAHTQSKPPEAAFLPPKAESERERERERERE